MSTAPCPLARGTPFEVTISAPNPLMGIEFRSDPIQGGSE